MKLTRLSLILASFFSLILVMSNNYSANSAPLHQGCSESPWLVICPSGDLKFNINNPQDLILSVNAKYPTTRLYVEGAIPDWLQISPLEISGGSGEFTISVDTSDLEPGEYENIFIVWADHQKPYPPHPDNPNSYVVRAGIYKDVVISGLVINSTGDGIDKSPGDNACDTGNKINRDGKEEPECTLRAAIQEANANSLPKNTITFDIPGSGPHTIQPQSALPTISKPLTIDGFSQPGSQANTFDITQLKADQPCSVNGVQSVVLDGSNQITNGLTSTAQETVIKGMKLSNFDLGLNLSGSNNSVTGMKFVNNLTSIIDSGGGSAFGGLSPEETNEMVGQGLDQGKAIVINTANNAVSKVLKNCISQVKDALDIEAKKVEVSANQIFSIGNDAVLLEGTTAVSGSADYEFKVDENNFSAVGNASVNLTAAQAVNVTIGDNDAVNIGALVKANAKCGVQLNIDSNTVINTGQLADITTEPCTVDTQADVAININNNKGNVERIVDGHYQTGTQVSYTGQGMKASVNGIEATIDAPGQKVTHSINAEIEVDGGSGIKVTALACDNVQYIVSGKLIGLGNAVDGLSAKLNGCVSANLEGSDLTIEKFIDAAIQVEKKGGGSAFIKCEHCEALNSGKGAIMFGLNFTIGNENIQAQNNGSIVISNSDFSGNDVGMEIIQSGVVSITNTNVSTNTLNGIIARDDSVILVDGSQINANGTNNIASSEGLAFAEGELGSAAVSGVGVRISGESKATIINSSICNNVNGFQVDQSSEINLTGNTICNNTEAGVQYETGNPTISESDILANNTMTGNGVDVMEVAQLASAFDVYLPLMINK